MKFKSVLYTFDKLGRIYDIIELDCSPIRNLTHPWLKGMAARTERGGEEISTILYERVPQTANFDVPIPIYFPRG